MSNIEEPPSALRPPPTMRALRKASAGPGLALDVASPVPEGGPNDVLIAVDFAGICGTDKHIYDWDAWSASRVPVGIVTGHEFVGRVVGVGAAVSRVAVGDRVSGEGHIGCGVCERCRTGQAHICRSLDIIGVDRDGCFAEFVLMPEHNVWPLSEAMPHRFGPLMDPLGNAMHAVSQAEVSGASVLVTGAGVIGLLSVAIARYRGARRIVATDVDEGRLALALRFGADEAVLAAPGWEDEARCAAGGEGVDVLVEMSGHQDAISGGLRALRNGGSAVLLGLPGQPVAIDLAETVIFKGATLRGINGRKMFETWYEVERFLAAARPDLEAIVSHVLPLSEYEKAFQLLGEHGALKVLFEVAG